MAAVLLLAVGCSRSPRGRLSPVEIGSTPTCGEVPDAEASMLRAAPVNSEPRAVLVGGTLTRRGGRYAFESLVATTVLNMAATRPPNVYRSYKDYDTYAIDLDTSKKASLSAGASARPGSTPVDATYEAWLQRSTQNSAEVGGKRSRRFSIRHNCKPGWKAGSHGYPDEPLDDDDMECGIETTILVGQASTTLVLRVLGDVVWEASKAPNPPSVEAYVDRGASPAIYMRATQPPGARIAVSYVITGEGWRDTTGSLPSIPGRKCWHRIDLCRTPNATEVRIDAGTLLDWVTLRSGPIPKPTPIDLDRGLPNMVGEGCSEPVMH